MKKTISIIVSVLIIGGAAYAAGSSITGSNNAKDKAFQDAGVAAEHVYDFETENERSGNNQATTTAPAKATSNVADIGSEEAKAIALKRAGVTEAETTRLRVERDRDDGRIEYNVEFHVGNMEYDYEIDAETGKIFEQDVDVENGWD